MKIKAFFFSLLIFSKVVMSQTGTIGSPFTSLYQARLVTSPGTYYFNLGGTTFNTYVAAQLTTNCPCDIKSTDTCSEDDHQKNRRASFNIIKAQVSNKGVINQ